MFLIVHATVGAVIGDNLESPAVGFLAGFLSHFFLDAIPHGDERVGRELEKPGRIHWLVVLAILDGLAAMSLVTVLWLSGFLNNAVGAFGGAIGGILPDVLLGLSEVSKKKIWPGPAPLESSSMNMGNVVNRISIPSKVNHSVKAPHFLMGLLRFHDWNHRLIDIELPLYIGGLIQVAVLLMALRLLGL